MALFSALTLGAKQVSFGWFGFFFLSFFLFFSFSFLLSSFWVNWVSITHRTLTWTAGSLTYVCDIFACTYIRRWGASLYRLIRRTSLQSLHRKWLWRNHRRRFPSPARSGYPSVWWPRSIVLNLAFGNCHRLDECDPSLLIPLALRRVLVWVNIFWSVMLRGMRLCKYKKGRDEQGVLWTLSAISPAQTKLGDERITTL